jgi:hypothetical protein
MKTLLIYPFLVFIIVLLSCNMATPKQGDEQQKKTKQNTGLIKFKSFSYIDKEGTGIEAFKMLMPSDWKFEGGIKWILDNPGMPAYASFKVHSPNGKEEFEVFPNQPFFWTTNQMILMTKPIGSRYFGNEVKPIVAATEAIKSIVLKRFRSNYPDMKITDLKAIPELARAVGAGQSQPGVQATADAAKVRIEYTHNGIPTEEEIYAVVESYSYQLPSGFSYTTNTNWYVDFIFSFKAEKGKLDANTKTFQTVAYSFKTSPLWFSKYNQVVEYLIKQQIQQIHNIGEMSRIISHTSNEISDMMMDSYNKRQAVNDKISENFSEYVRGVETYVDPYDNSRTMELPSEYDHAWINNNGEVIMTDNPNYNPNVESNLHWQEMPKKK